MSSPSTPTISALRDRLETFRRKTRDEKISSFKKDNLDKPAQQDKKPALQIPLNDAVTETAKIMAMIKNKRVARQEARKRQEEVDLIRKQQGEAEVKKQRDLEEAHYNLKIISLQKRLSNFRENNQHKPEKVAQEQRRMLDPFHDCRILKIEQEFCHDLSSTASCSNSDISLSEDDSGSYSDIKSDNDNDNENNDKRVSSMDSPAVALNCGKQIVDSIIQITVSNNTMSSGKQQTQNLLLEDSTTPNKRPHIALSTVVASLDNSCDSTHSSNQKEQMQQKFDEYPLLLSDSSYSCSLTDDELDWEDDEDNVSYNPIVIQEPSFSSSHSTLEGLPRRPALKLTKDDGSLFR